jgi:hypothetical protein
MASDKKVVEAEFVPVPEGEAPELRAEFAAGIDATGSVYWRISGPDQSLIVLEGLLKYARNELDRLWARSHELSQKASQEQAGA